MGNKHRSNSAQFLQPARYISAKIEPSVVVPSYCTARMTAAQDIEAIGSDILVTVRAIDEEQIDRLPVWQEVESRTVPIDAPNSLARGMTNETRFLPMALFDYLPIIQC